MRKALTIKRQALELSLIHLENLDKEFKELCKTLKVSFTSPYLGDLWWKWIRMRLGLKGCKKRVGRELENAVKRAVSNANIDRYKRMIRDITLFDYAYDFKDLCYESDVIESIYFQERFHWYVKNGRYGERLEGWIRDGNDIRDVYQSIYLDFLRCNI